MIDQVQGLAQSRSAPFGQWQLVVLAVEGDVFAAPDLTADVDDLAGAAHRGVERDAMEALDHLRTGRPDAEPEPPVGDVVDAGRRHGEQRRGARVDRHDAGAELDGGCLCRQVTELADRIERVRLRDERDVDAALLELDDLLGRLTEAVGVVEKDSGAHRWFIHPNRLVGSRRSGSVARGTSPAHGNLRKTTQNNAKQSIYEV